MALGTIPLPGQLLMPQPLCKGPTPHMPQCCLIPRCQVLHTCTAHVTHAAAVSFKLCQCCLLAYTFSRQSVLQAFCQMAQSHTDPITPCQGPAASSSACVSTTAIAPLSCTAGGLGLSFQPPCVFEPHFCRAVQSLPPGAAWRGPGVSLWSRPSATTPSAT